MARQSTHGRMAILSLGAGCPVVVAAGRVPAIRSDDETIRYASGCGQTADEALEKCVLELAERTSAQFSGFEEIVRCPPGALNLNSVLPPEIMLFSNSQYDGSGSPECHSEDFPRPWSPSASIDWVRATVALSSEEYWLPAGLAFIGHSRDRAAGLVPADTNGLAAGRSVEEATVRAFMELVERDAVAIWWYNRLVRPQLERDALGDPLVSRYAEWTRSMGRPLRLIDLTHDFNIPVVAAVAHDPDGGHIALGFGAGINAGDAARHAVGELVQFECNVALIERRERASGEADATAEALQLLRWWRDIRIDECPHLKAVAVAPPPAAIDLLGLADCHAMCAIRGLRFFALDLTRQPSGTPVVRVIVPGLRPMRPRFAPGRLFDVPVKLGWLRRPRTESELNPVPMVF